VDSSHVFGMYLEFFIFGYLRILLGFGELIFNSSWRLQIHYDRFGKDGLFSHREVSVLFVPDLSECLPSLDAWRDQWLAHKRAVAERERQFSLEKEVCSYFVWNIGFISFTFAKVFGAKKKSSSNEGRDRNSKYVHVDVHIWIDMQMFLLG
jgi:hypothetical protein